jgi:hypothetical protein
VSPVPASMAANPYRSPRLCPPSVTAPAICRFARHVTKTARNGTHNMAMTVLDHVRERAFVAVESGGDRDTCARQLLAASGGDRHAVLTTYLQLAEESSDTPDELQNRRVLKLVERAIVLGDTENLWHPVFSTSASH